MIYIGLDDTDTLESVGTGHLARLVAAELSADYIIEGVTRHQLLDDPRVPRTAKNSCAAILVKQNGHDDLDNLFEWVRAIMQDNFQPGSDPGLCVADTIPPEITAFGRRSQQKLVTQNEAKTLACQTGLRLEGLGGTQDGVIGALSAVGLAACGEDGRYVQVGTCRDLHGIINIADLMNAGVTAVQTIKRQPVSNGKVMVDRLRPARRGSRPIAIVEWQSEYWKPLKLD